MIYLYLRFRAFFYVCKNCSYYKKAIKRRKILKNRVEVNVVRVKITLECTECKQRNYNTTKEKRLHPERMETKKYCRFCRKHTNHKETK